jgi:hypothetical protein
MPTEMKLWRIDGERPAPMAQQKLDLESRLEEWLRHDTSLISADLLVIGQQVETAYGGFIDLLAVDPVGNLVILELKRDKTPRDIVAQALDYASWVQDLGHESITEIATSFLKGKTLEQAFREKFQTDLPDVLNERHRMYIVASSLDSATERIVKYLSETHDVDINVATFAYFKTEQGELLGRSLLLDEEQVQDRAQTKSKRRPNLTWEELELHAEQHGVLPLYKTALNELRPLFDGATRSQSNLSLVGQIDGSRSAIMGLYPDASSAERGLAIMIYLDRVVTFLGIPEEEMKTFLGPASPDAATWDPIHTWFFDSERLAELINRLTEARERMSNQSVQATK